MAITATKIATYAKNIVDLPDRPNENGYTAATLKAFFDGRTDEEIKTIINLIVDDLTALDTNKLADIVSDTTPQLGGELDQNSFTIGGVEYDNGNSGTAKVIDWKKGNHQKVTMTGNCTFTFTNPTKPCMLSLRFINDSTAGRTITLPTIKWINGNSPTWTTTANAIDILSLYFDGTNYYGQAGLNFI